MMRDQETALLLHARAANDAAPACRRRPDAATWLQGARWLVTVLLVLNGLGLMAAVVLDLATLPAMRFGWGMVAAAVVLALLDLAHWFERDPTR